MRKLCISAIAIVMCTTIAGAQSTEHTVEKGETLYGIAHEYGVRLDVLMAANDIDDPTSLSVGTELVIPTAYRVVKNDTLWSIAHEYSVTVDELRELNELDEDYILRVGDLLLVPGVTYVPAGKTGSVSVQQHDDTTVDSEQLETSSETSALLIESSLESPFWPLDGERSVREGKMPGTEISGNPGDFVYAVANGVVLWNAPFRGMGRVIIVESENGYSYFYGGTEAVSVELYERVTAGSRLGKLGVDPNTGEARLFFAVFKNGEIVDPEQAPRG